MTSIDLLHELAKQRQQELRLLAARQRQHPSRASPAKALRHRLTLITARGPETQSQHVRQPSLVCARHDACLT